MSKEEYLELNITTNAIYSLQSVKDALLSDTEYKWRNAVIFIVHSLYMFCIANLEGTNYENVLTNDDLEDGSVYVKKGNENKWKRSRMIWRGNIGGYTIAWDYVDGEPSSKGKPIRGFNRTEKTHLINFWTALARVQDKEMYSASYIFSEALSLTDDEWVSIERLYSFYSEFLNFVPTSLLLTFENFKKDIINILKPIEFLSSKSNIFLFNDEAKKIKISEITSDIRSILINY